MATGGRITTLAPGNEGDQIVRCMKVLSNTQGYILEEKKALEEEKKIFCIERERQQEDLRRKEAINNERVKRDKEQLAQERHELEDIKNSAARIAATDKQHIITFKVGDDVFDTDMRTLQRHDGSIFPRLCQEIGRRGSNRDSKDIGRPFSVFIDRDSMHFRFILNYMRQGEEIFRGTALRGKDEFDLEDMILEARYYKLHGLIKLLERHKIRIQQATPIDFKRLLTEKYFAAPNPQLKMYETARQLLFKSRNMKGIKFEDVHFKHRVSFEGSILEGAIFQCCKFDAMIIFSGADITNVRFEHCVKFLPDRFVMDGEDAKKCGVVVNPPVDLKAFCIQYAPTA